MTRSLRLFVSAVLILLTALAPALTAAAAAGVSSAGTGSPTAQVPGDGAVATATLTTVRPAFVSTETEIVTLRGTVRNTSDGTLVDPLPALRWSLDALQSAEELDLITSDPLFRYGRVDYGYSTSLPDLDPGEEASFRLDVPLGDLLPGPGVYVVGVDVLATLPDGLRVFVASARTTVAVDVPDRPRVPVAMLWPLATDPSLLPDGRLLDDAIATEIATGGRLEALVAAASDDPVTWVLDPDLLTTVAAMTGGYETLRPPGAGSGSADAPRFLAQLGAALTPSTEVWALPVADPDAGGLLEAGIPPTDVARLLATTDTPSPLTELVGQEAPPVAMLAQRRVTAEVLQTYGSAGVTTAVLAPDTVVSPSDASIVPLDASTSTAVLATRLVPALQDPAVRPALEVRQRVLAETALAATDQPPRNGLVLVPPLRWRAPSTVLTAALQAWRDAPWVDPVPMQDVPRGADAATLLPDLPAPRPVPEVVISGLQELRSDLQRLEPLFASPPLTEPALSAASARATSTAWVGDPVGGAAYVAALQQGVAGAEQRISLVLSDSITLSSRSGRFPVTIVNDSDADVVVGVRFTSQNSSRLRVEDAPPTLLTAGEKRTVTAVALATANGRVVVSADLVTTEGEPVGTPEVTVVDVTDVGALGWTVIAAGAALMAAALVRGRLRRTRAPTQPEVPMDSVV